MKLTAADGVELHAEHFVASAPRATVVIAPAMGVPQRFYARFATAAAAAGFHVITFDYRGVGASKAGHARDMRDGLPSWGLDLSAAVQHAHGLGAPVLLVTHSVGGQLLAFLDHPERVAGAYTVASQFGRIPSYDGLERWKVAIFFYVLIPLLTPIFGYFPGRVIGSEDLPPAIATDWARWGRHPRYVLGDGEHVQAGYAAFRAPVVAVGLDDDTLYAPPRTIDDLAAALRNARVTRVQIHPSEAGGPVGHFGFFRDRFADTLWRRAFAELGAMADAASSLAPTAAVGDVR